MQQQLAESSLLKREKLTVAGDRFVGAAVLLQQSSEGEQGVLVPRVHLDPALELVDGGGPVSLLGVAEHAIVESLARRPGSVAALAKLGDRHGARVTLAPGLVLGGQAL